MFKFFDSIFGFITTIVDYIATAIESFITVLKQVSAGVLFVAETVMLLPPFCRGAMAVLVAICIVSLLLSVFIDFK